jgi:hypothetical protein
VSSTAVAAVGCASTAETDVAVARDNSAVALCVGVGVDVGVDDGVVSADASAAAEGPMRRRFVELSPASA